MNAIDLGIGSLAALGLVSVLGGWAMRWVTRRWSNQAALERAKSLIVAHLLEFRLFGDEPALVWRAQREVARQSLRVFRLLLLPVAIMTLPMLFLFAQLDAVFGKAPLAVGEAGVLTAHWNGSGETPRLEAGPGIAIESPPVRAGRQVSWRFRPNVAGRGTLRVVSGGGAWTKSVTAGAGPAYVSERRMPLGVAFALQATEPPLTGGDLERIEIGYGNATVQGFHWLLWFLLFSGLAFLMAR